MKRSLVLLLALGACVAPPKAPPPPKAVPRPAPAPVPPQQPLIGWEDRARTPGNWSYRRDGDVSVAEFRNAGTVLFSMTCRTGNVTFLRPGPEELAMTITTTSMSLRLLGSPDSLTYGAMGTVPATSSLLDAMIYSRGRFMVFVAGQPDLIIPPWPEIARVVEDCRH